MTAPYNSALIAAAGLSMFAALVHVAIIFGGPEWYRFFGAGNRIAEAAERGDWYPPLVTLFIAAVLAAWSAYAWSGAGLLPRLPFLKPVLFAITAIYLARGLVVVPMVFLARDKLTPFWLWSSLICSLYGIIHLAGLAQVWTIIA